MSRKSSKYHGESPPNHAKLHNLLHRSMNNPIDRKLHQEKDATNILLQDYLEPLAELTQSSTDEAQKRLLEQLKQFIHVFLSTPIELLKHTTCCSKQMQEIQTLQHNWPKDWPGRQLATKILLAISRITRLIQFLVGGPVFVQS
jgi:hypothetical protein